MKNKIKKLTLLIIVLTLFNTMVVNAETNDYSEINEEKIEIRNNQNRDLLAVEGDENDGSGDGNPVQGQPINCDDFKYEIEAIGTYNIIDQLFNIIMILGPILLIVFGTIDFAKASLAGDESALKKAGSNFIKRTIAAVLLFLIPYIVGILLSVAFDAGVFGEGLNEVPDICVNGE